MQSLPRVTALYKTFDGGEWVDASLASIYHDVDAIVMVHSETSWLGESGNNVEAPAREWQELHDVDHKIHHVNADGRTQEEQYAAGLKYIEREKLPAELILAIDTDEVWEPGSLLEAKQQTQSVHADAYQVSMHSYLRTPFYRVRPAFGAPVCLFRDASWLTKCPRGCKAPSKLLRGVWMHHFTYVRSTDECVARKLRQSCQADGGERIVPDWMETVWPRLPHGENLHAFQRWRHVWRTIHRVYMPDLPKPVREANIMRQFWPESLMLDGERNALYDLVLGRSIAVDLGTYQGSSAIVLSLACGHVHTVDLFEQVAGRGAEADSLISYEELWHKTSSRDVPATLRQYGNITLHQCETTEAANLMADNSVDVVFVDADHSYEGTRRNWVTWFSKLKLGGLLVFHDDNELHPGVQRAVRELNNNHIVRRVGLCETAGSLAAFEKVTNA